MHAMQLLQLEKGASLDKVMLGSEEINPLHCWLKHQLVSKLA